MSWRDQATCLGADFGLFVVDQARGVPPTEAMRYCVGCPVRMECLQEGMNDDGVWGGTTAGHRSDIRAGRLTVHQAMAAGDRIAGLKTRLEQRTVREPWLGGAA